MKNLQFRILFFFLVVNCFATGSMAATPADSIPKGWHAARFNTPEFLLGTDMAVRHGGMYSGFIKCNPSPTAANGSLMQSVAADAYRNKRVKLSVYLQTKDAQSAFIFMSVHTSDSAIAYSNTKNEAISENTGWRLFHITLDIPADSRNIDFGVILSGQGTVWIDDCTLEVVDNATPSDDMIAKGLIARKKLIKRNDALNTNPVNMGFEDQ